MVQPERALELAVVCSTRQRNLASRTSSTSEVVLGRFDSQYLVGSGLPTGHSTSSQRTGSS
jgi:hypothetical protein